MSQIIEASPVAMFILSGDHTVTHWNQACAAITGLSAGEMIGNRDIWRAFYSAPRPLLANLVLEGATEDVVQTLFGGKVRASASVEGGWEGIDCLGDERRWYSFAAYPLFDLEGRVDGALQTITDITKDNQRGYELEFYATHDSITNLPNRFLLIDRLDLVLRQAEHSLRPVSVLYIGISGLRLINASFGHHAGDQVLKDLASRLKQCVRNYDLVVRFGSDEFVILLTEQTTEEGLVQMAERCIAAVSEPFHADGHDNYLAAAIGMASFPQDGCTTTTLLQGAVSAMHRVKKRGGEGLMFHDGQLREETTERAVIRGAVGKALECGQFDLHFQPKCRLSDSQVTGFEALLRWTHPNLGSVEPAKFIPILEETGQIVQIGEWVIDEALRNAASWGERGSNVAVNLSARQLWQPDLPYRIEKILARHGIPPHRLELEITESMLMQDAELVTRSLEALNEMGIGLAIDDFGTGYSSLAYLKRFPIQAIKVDASFIAELETSCDDQEIVRAIITMGQRLGRKVIAEGVETDLQRRILADLGCDEMQGYLFSPPVPADQLGKFLSMR